MLKQRYAIMALLFATWLLGGCGGENSLQPGSPSEPQETASVTLSIYTGREISRAVGLPGDPGTSPELPDAIENINLFMYVEPKNGAAAYMEHYYIELPESTAYYEFQAIDVPKCTASFYAIVNAGSHYEWDALSTEDEVMALTTIATPSRDLYAGTLLDLELVQMKHSGVIDAGLVASKVDIMYNIGTAISNYNAKPAGQKEHGDCTSAKVVSLKLKNVPKEGKFFAVRSNDPVVDHVVSLTGNSGPGQSAWINGRYDCYLYDSGTLDIELVVQSVYADTYVKMTTYNIHVDTPEDLAVAPYYLLRFDVVGFTQTEYNYRWTASI
ncbi:MULTISPECIES: hypothetical protein [Barnesiella]|nr:hypothetical protein [Barnesiella sp.]OKY89817.1 MAG: hypothetical protein BHV70_01340 [Bacteroidales bacterium 55_9]